MNILMIAINDPAGTAIEFTKAINKYSEHTCRLITKEIRYNFMFEKDLHLPWLDSNGWDEVEVLLRTSDVIHFHMTADEFIELGPFRPVDYMKGKIIVHHHHGHPDFRGNPEKYRNKYKKLGRRKLLVSTPDLLKLLPEAKWQPNLVPIDNPLYMPYENKPKDRIIICHSPTRKDLKNSEEFLYAVGRLQTHSEGTIEVRLIENTLHRECLRQKRESHILFDHLQGYFGVSSLEGLSQGLCVVAGLDIWNQYHIEIFTGTSKLPWVTMKRENLRGQFKSLIANRFYVEEKSKQARHFMQSRWHPERIVTHLLESLLVSG